MWGASETTTYERKAIYLSSINWLINLYGAAGNVAQHEHPKTVSVCTPLQTLCCGWSFSLQTSLFFLCFLRHMDTVADVAAAAVGLAINRQIAAIRRENWQIRPFANRSPLSTHNYASASEWVCNRIYIGLQSTAVCVRLCTRGSIYPTDHLRARLLSASVWQHSCLVGGWNECVCVSVYVCSFAVDWRKVTLFQDWDRLAMALLRHCTLLACRPRLCFSVFPSHFALLQTDQ